MNTKKVIGTIIGVIAFIALVAGATYAWLTINATVTNGTYNGGSKHFYITYDGGSAISAVKMLASGSATKTNITSAGTAGASTTDGWLAVTASKDSGSAKASSFKINLDISNNTLVSNSIVYALCVGTCTTTGALATVSNGVATCGTNVTTCGVIDGGDETDQLLYNDTTTFNVDGTVSETTYNIYFWLNADSIVDTDIGKSFTASISAEATQGE